MAEEADFQRLIESVPERIREMNLSEATFETGESVIISGLTNATHYNCKVGTIVSQNESTGRYIVRLGGQATLQIRSNNLRHFGITVLQDNSEQIVGGPWARNGTQIESQVGSDSTLRRLMPLSDLPCFHSSDAASFLNPQLETVVRKFYDGSSLSIGWIHKGDSLQVLANDEGALSGSQQMILTISLLRYSMGPVLSWGFSGVYRLELTEGQKKNLTNRILHWLIRVRGNMLGADATWLIGEHLSVNYSQRKYWKENLDAAVVVTNVLVNLGCDRLLSSAWNKLGEALENCGRFREAAEVYWEGSETHCNEKLEHQESLFCNSGLAYKRNEDFNEAERAYILSMYCRWKRMSQGQLLGQQDVTMLFNNLILMYADWSRKCQMQKGHVRDYLVLLALCHTAGVDDSDGLADELKRTFSAIGSQFRALLMVLSQSPREALSKLIDMMGAGNVEGFHSKIRSCLDPNFQLHFWQMPSANPRPVGDKNLSFNKRNARKQTGEIREHNFLFCGNPLCSTSKVDTELMQCPCKTVSYCDKKCQVAHWKASHRDICPFSKKNKKAAGK